MRLCDASMIAHLFLGHLSHRSRPCHVMIVVDDCCSHALCRTQFGKSALALVVESAGSWEVKHQLVRMLLDAGAEDSALDRSLIAAARAKNVDDVKELLAAGANKDAKAEVRSCGVESVVVDRFIRRTTQREKVHGW